MPIRKDWEYRLSDHWDRSSKPLEPITIDINEWFKGNVARPTRETFVLHRCVKCGRELFREVDGYSKLCQSCDQLYYFDGCPCCGVETAIRRDLEICLSCDAKFTTKFCPECELEKPTDPSDYICVVCRRIQ